MRTTTIVLSLMLGSTMAWAQQPLAPQPPPPPPPPPPQAAPPAYPAQPYPPPQYPPQYYPPPQPGWMPAPPPPVRYELKPNYALLFAGVGVLGFGYLLDISSTLLASHQPAWECAIPVVGPYLQVNDSFSTTWSGLAQAFYVTDGLFQTAGFVLTILGASLWHKVPVRMAQSGLVVTF